MVFSMAVGAYHQTLLQFFLKPLSPIVTSKVGDVAILLAFIHVVKIQTTRLVLIAITTNQLGFVFL